MVLISGSSCGLGWAMAEALAERGAHVVLNRRDPASLAERVEALRGRGRGLAASASASNATDEPTMVEAVAAIAREHGRLDVAIANAGSRTARHSSSSRPSTSTA